MNPITSIKKAIRRSLISIIHNIILTDDIVRLTLWSITNQRPAEDLIYLPCDIQKEMYRMATEKSARFLMNNHPEAKPFRDQENLLAASVKQALETNQNGLYLEFGVYSGRTINIIADLTTYRRGAVHGFDSFEGLPEDWNETAGKGSFSCNGKLPAVRENVELHKGWFNETLPEFMKNNHGKISFIHIDSDLYSSAKTVLTCLKDRITSGTIIQFDEFLNYPTYEQHEYMAFFEFIEETQHAYSCIGYDACGFAVSFQIK